MSGGEGQSDAEREAQDTMRDYPAYMRSLRIHAVVTPLHEDTVRQARPLLRTLLLAVIVVLLIARANLAEAFVVRAIPARTESAVMPPLGAPPGALLLQSNPDRPGLGLHSRPTRLACARLT